MLLWFIDQNTPEGLDEGNFASPWLRSHLGLMEDPRAPDWKRKCGWSSWALKKTTTKKEACSWLCRPKCLYEVRHLSSAWIFSHVNSLHPHTHSRRLGYFSYVMNGGKKMNSRSVASHSWPGTLYTEKLKTQTPHPAACPFYRLRAP